MLKVVLLNVIYKVSLQVKRNRNWQFGNLQAHFLYVHLKKEREENKKEKKERKKEIKHLLSIVDGENPQFCCLDQTKMTGLLSC